MVLTDTSALQNWRRLYDLARALEPRLGDVHIYVLLDMAQCAPAQFDALSALSWLPHRLYQGLYAGDGLERVDPWLVAYPVDQGTELWDTLCGTCADLSMISLIVSRLSVDKLLQHLRRQLEMRDEAQRLHILRWSDTRCLPLLYHVFDDVQRTRLMAGMMAWLYFGRDGEPVLLSGEPDVALDLQNQSQPYGLSGVQMQALQTSARPDAMLAKIAGRPAHYGILQGRPSARYQVVQGVLKQAAGGMTDAELLRQICDDLSKSGLLLS